MTLDHAVDKARYETSIARLHTIFEGMSNSANEVSTWRCPYKSVESRCTANFWCRNQDRTVPTGEAYICTGSDDLDYRQAWEGAGAAHA